jgi:hypothetical protein
LTSDPDIQAFTRIFIDQSHHLYLTTPLIMQSEDHDYHHLINI